jgi:hypothetical protein
MAGSSRGDFHSRQIGGLHWIYHQSRAYGVVRAGVGAMWPLLTLMFEIAFGVA